MRDHPNFGQQPVGFSTQGSVSDHFSSMHMREPVAKIAHLLKEATEGHIRCALSASELGLLLRISEDFNLMPVYRHIGGSGIAGILDAVRNRILDWALALEAQGVLGEGMTFSIQEKQAAASVIFNISGPVGSLVGQSGQVAIDHLESKDDHSTVSSATNSPNAVVTSASGRSSVRQRISSAIAGQVDPGLAEALKELAAIITASNELAEDQRAEIDEHLAFIAEQCRLPAVRRQPLVVIKSVLKAFGGALSFAKDALEVWSKVGPIITTALGGSGVG
jgi:hypothetical protein